MGGETALCISWGTIIRYDFCGGCNFRGGHYFREGINESFFPWGGAIISIGGAIIIVGGRHNYCGGHNCAIISVGGQHFRGAGKQCTIIPVG
jgi:hypothetical protein